MQVIEGRLIWFLMGKVVFHENQDLEENLLAQQRHRIKMMDNDLCTDLLVRMSRNFIVEEGDEFSSFQDLHRESCMLLQIHKKQYRKRKLKSCALVLAIFMMIEREVEESKDETAKRMFVEVFPGIIPERIGKDGRSGEGNGKTAKATEQSDVQRIRRRLRA